MPPMTEKIKRSYRTVRRAVDYRILPFVSRLHPENLQLVFKTVIIKRPILKEHEPFALPSILGTITQILQLDQSVISGRLLIAYFL